MLVRLGTRGSQLALWQANWVAGQLRSSTDVDVELIEIRTSGDEGKGAIGGLGTQGVFTKEIQQALLSGKIDLAVHSLKDLPTEPVAGLCLAAVPRRESPVDVLISRNGQPFSELHAGAVVGTGSIRRRAQLLHFRPDITMADIRGNVDTRLRKLKEGRYDAIVLAHAGLNRLGLASEATEVFTADHILPAVGQGALGLETRSNDTPLIKTLAALDHRESHLAVLAERALLAELRGGCLAPVGAWGRITDSGALQLSAVVLSADGAKRLFCESQAECADVAHCVSLGQRVAGDLIRQGATDLIVASRSS